MQVSDDVLQALLPHTGLRSLSCSNTRYSDGAGLLARFPHLTALHLDGCSNIRGGPAGLSHLTELRQLSLARCRDVAVCTVLAMVKASPHLTHLDVSWCRGAANGHDSCMQLAGGLAQLRHLNLSSSRVSQAVLAQLGQLSSLRELMLSAFALGGAATSAQGANVQDSPDMPAGKRESVLAPLAALAHLTYLDIKWAKVRLYA